MEKLCIACGMPMSETDHFAGGDPSKDYCVHCTREDGSMKSYEEAFTSMVKFMIKTQGVTSPAASKAVKEMMDKLPAWQTLHKN